MNIDEQYLRTIINESVRRIVKEELGKYCLNEIAMPRHHRKPNILFFCRVLPRSEIV